MRLLPKNRELGWTPYAWLVYLPLWVIPAWFDATCGMRLLVVAGIVAFLPLYFWAYWLEGRRKLWAVAGITLLGCVCLPWNPGATVFFVYAATFIGYAAEPRIAYRYLAGLLCIIAAESWALRIEASYWIAAIVFSALLGAVMIYHAEQRRGNRRLDLAQEEVERLAKIAERERIRRDLHDLLGHTLSVIVLKSELASKLAETDPARSVAEIREVERISREALAEVRAAVAGYRSIGLESELERVRQTLAAAGLQVEWAISPVPLSRAQEAVLALALREAATNIIRHARATSCRLRMERAGPLCELEISDNGTGGNSGDGSGLSGMRERLEAMGGSVEVRRAAGTTLLLRLPVSTI
jgi:two-component system sensor histidine kinase DesK